MTGFFTIADDLLPLIAEPSMWTLSDPVTTTDETDPLEDTDVPPEGDDGTLADTDAVEEADGA